MSARYDPVTLQILDASTAYEEVHEFAHMEQDMRHTLAWRIRKAFADRTALRYTGLSGVAEIACEIEAAFMARRDMLRCNLWGRTERREAISGLLSYVKHTLFSW